MNRLSLRTVIVTMMLVIALACTLLYNAVYGMLTDQTFSEMDLQSIGQNLDLAKTRLDHILLDAQTLLSDAETQIHAASYFDPGSFRRSIMQRLEYEDSVSSVILYDASGTPLCTVGRSDATFSLYRGYSADDWILSALETPEISYSPARLEHCFRDNYEFVAVMAQPVEYFPAAEAAPQKGLLTVSIRLDVLASVCIEQSGEGRGQLILLTAAGEPLYSPRAKLNSLTQLSPEFTGVGVRQPDSQLLELSKPLAGEKWILLTQVNQYQMQSTQQTLHNKSLIVLALSLLLGFVLALLLSALISRPLKAMEQTIEQSNGASAAPRVRTRGLKEFASFARHYNEMLDRIDTLNAETAHNQEQLRQMEIAALEEQINPHFLYNALDSITWLVETGRGSAAVNMITSLAQLLRLSIHRGGNFHTVRREVDHVRSYLTIQQTRGGNRFRVELDAAPETLDLLCPRLILQPLAENAIKHGIGDNTGCRIAIRVFIENDRLIMTVSDDGMGILPDKLRQIQQELDAGSPPNPDEISGLALKSVNRRIRLLCGEDSGITIDSEMEEWTCARITLPLRR